MRTFREIVCLSADRSAAEMCKSCREPIGASRMQLATTAKQAIGLIGRARSAVDLILLDVDLPDLDNDEVDALVSRFVEESQSDNDPTSDAPSMESPVWPPHAEQEEDTHETGLALPPEAKGKHSVEPLAEHDPEQAAEGDKKDAAAQEKAE